MPEGDTIAYAANRIRPVLEGRVPDEIVTPQPRHALDRWPERLAGRAVKHVDTHGKHLFLRFEGDLVLHSHLGMSAPGACTRPGRRWGRSPRRAWIVFRAPGHEVVEFDGPLLELMTDRRTRFDQRLAALGPDMLATEFDRERFLVRLPPTTRPAGSATRCSTSATWPASATSGRPRAVGRRPSTRGAGARRDRRRGRGDHRGDAAADAALRRRTWPAGDRPRVLRARKGGRARGAATRSRRRGQGDENRTAFWCRDARR